MSRLNSPEITGEFIHYLDSGVEIINNDEFQLGRTLDYQPQRVSPGPSAPTDETRFNPLGDRTARAAEGPT
jgi:anthranilate/para-aminobenzoate synthase component II